MVKQKGLIDKVKVVGFDALPVMLFQDMGQFWLADADMTKFNTRPGKTCLNHPQRPGRSDRSPHDRDAGGESDLQNRRRQEDHLDHRIPDQTG